MRVELNNICKELGIEYVGVVDKGPYKELEERIREEGKQ